MPKSKSTKATKSSKKAVSKEIPQKQFLVVLILFAGFSIYAIASFFVSTNDYLDNMFVSVAGNPSEEALVEVVEPDPIFTDVFTSHVYSEAIERLYYEGIMKGYDDGSFRPDDTINRAEFLTVLTTVVDADFSGGIYENCFNDVTNEWYSTFVCYAKNNEWVKGFADNTYKPGQPVTKAEGLKIVLEAVDYEVCAEMTEAPYKDVPLDAWYAPYACAAKNSGIVSRVGMFSPDYLLTRANYADIIYKVMTEQGML